VGIDIRFGGIDGFLFLLLRDHDVHVFFGGILLEADIIYRPRSSYSSSPSKRHGRPRYPRHGTSEYFGGSLSGGGGAFAFAGVPAAPALVPVPAPIATTLGIAHGGGGRRIAPTPVPQVGFGSTEVSRIAHAKALTPAQRRDMAERLRLELDALTLVDEEDEDVGGEEGADERPKKRKR
jgi:hypothetical protein